MPDDWQAHAGCGMAQVRHAGVEILHLSAGTGGAGGEGGVAGGAEDAGCGRKEWIGREGIEQRDALRVNNCF